jgi:simple sugar transport system substrate-binding protein
MADAASLFRVRYEWTGSMRSNVADMVAAMRAAIRQKADGIAVSIIDPAAFNAPTAQALARGIPVVSYNADGGRGNQRLAYVGQDLYQSGLKFGARITELVGEGDVLIFIATPGQLNIQPRVDGALDAIRDSGKPINARVVATGPSVAGERKRIESAYHAHRHVRGMFAVDGGSTQGVADVMLKHGLHKRGVRAGGYDLLPQTLRGIVHGRVDFTIDQQPYLQGFVPIMQLFLARYSGGLVSPADTNTGLLFVTRKNVKPYVTTHTRYEGSSSVRRYPVS